jgi:hypothetical protein
MYPIEIKHYDPSNILLSYRKKIDRKNGDHFSARSFKTDDIV